MQLNATNLIHTMLNDTVAQVQGLNDSLMSLGLQVQLQQSSTTGIPIPVMLGLCGLLYLSSMHGIHTL